MHAYVCGYLISDLSMLTKRGGGVVRGEKC